MSKSRLHPGVRGFRMTRQRKVVLEAVRTCGTHPTADEVYLQVRRVLPRISMGTVYRNLDVLCRLGMLGRVASAGVQMRFDRSPERHYHVICVTCGRVADASVARLGDIERRVRVSGDFEVLSHNLEFRGLCPACRRKGGRRGGIRREVSST